MIGILQDLHLVRAIGSKSVKKLAQKTFFLEIGHVSKSTHQDEGSKHCNHWRRNFRIGCGI